jgi:predicted DNA-binding protein (MmcQ/YjbR family)
VKPAAIRRLCLSLPGATESIQWGGERVFKVGGKMFAVISAARGADAMSFKASDESFRLLTELPGLSPAPYLARAQWVKIAPLASLPEADLAAYLRRAYEIVAAGLPKTVRGALATSRTASARSPARRASRGL